MKTHLTDEIDLSSNSKPYAAEQTWQRAMRQPAEVQHAQGYPAQDRQAQDRQAQGRQAGALGNFAAVIALSIAFCTLLLLSMRSTPPPVIAQTFELQARPIWISTVPYAPRDGLVPDFGQPNFGQSSFREPQQTQR
jgi:histidinol-phosphate/aromatic aminotransferase/cobyric acid decarboxylase-like protein